MDRILFWLVAFLAALTISAMVYVGLPMLSLDLPPPLATVLALAVGFACFAALFLFIRNSNAPAASHSTAQPGPASKSTAQAVPAFTPSSARADSANKALENALYRDLILKTSHDAEMVERLIAYEKRYLPNASRVELMQAAKERWEHN